MAVAVPTTNHKSSVSSGSSPAPYPKNESINPPLTSASNGMETTSPVSYIPKDITSLDCKILQYQYAISKLEHFIKSIKRISSECNENSTNGASATNTTTTATTESTNGESEAPKEVSPERKLTFSSLPLLHYIVLLSGTVFAISENAFNPKLDLLANYKLFKPTPINISTITTHIPYDNPDSSVGILTDLPKVSTALKCLKALESLAVTCLQGYQKRLAQAKLEQSKLIKDDLTKYYDDLKAIVEKDIFNTDTDIDITLEGLTFSLPKDQNLLENENFVEATLIDIDIKMLFLINKQIDVILNRLKPIILTHKTLKRGSNKTVDTYALHQIFLLTLRLNDVYTVFRRFGRKIFLSNYSHLTDSKFLFQAKNGNYFKNTHLANVDETFNTMKKNGTLIANLTRLVRQDSRFEINPKNINDLVNFANQGHVMLEQSTEKFDAFSQEWITTELRFRKIYQLPKKNLFDIYQSFHEVRPPPIITLNSKQITGSQSTSSKESSSSELEAFPSVSSSNGGAKSLEKGLKKLDLDAPKPATRGSRSSSINSVSSNGSLTNKPLMRKNSLNSPNRNSVLIVPNAAPSNGKVSPLRSRPNSMLFLNSNGSMSNIEGNISSNNSGNINQSPAVAAAGSQTRRRANSQPVKGTPSLNEAIATSGAAAALIRNHNLNAPSSSPTASLRSPTGSINRKPPASTNGKNASPAPNGNKVQKSLLAVKEEEDGTGSPSPTPASSKLSANQRLQQHLRQAAKSGTLMTQEKEILTPVTFDPNAPSSVSIRKYIDPPPQPKEPSPPQEIGSSSGPIGPVSKPRRTRDMVTRRNTQQNSVTKQIDPQSIETSSSYSTDSSSGSGKRVRFTGVPEYSEAEDAPTKYSHPILRNFAVFKSPIRVGNSKPTAFKKKDQLLKKEESLSFKYQVHHQSAEDDSAF
ncbi:uncharacterized protein RJT20DRAFT_123956 [Scheffersomyces xylosifermentans]|uniref:uncharacterized protein n=1 Tax=Scheffersomyces xylosifermentans TaxID=1304137 RepID=UPI00315DAD10